MLESIPFFGNPRASFRGTLSGGNASVGSRNLNSFTLNTAHVSYIGDRMAKIFPSIDTDTRWILQLGRCHTSNAFLNGCVRFNLLECTFRRSAPPRSISPSSPCTCHNPQFSCSFSCVFNWFSTNFSLLWFY